MKFMCVKSDRDESDSPGGYINGCHCSDAEGEDSEHWVELSRSMSL